MKSRTRTGQENLDVIVVGGGLSGLTAASCLARAGHNVTLFEKASKVGGRAISQARDGFHMNLGAHAMQAGGEAVKVLNELGVPYSGGSPKKYWVVRDGKVHIFPASPISLLRTSLLSAGAKLEAGRILMSLQKMNPEEYQTVPLRVWLEGAVRDPQVRDYIETSARVVAYTHAPDVLSTGFFIQQLRTAAKGVLYIDGGWQTIVDGLRSVAEGAGVRIVTGTKVEAVEQSNGEVTGLRLQDGSALNADAVIIAAGPSDSSQLLEGQNDALNSWAEHSTPVHFACLDITLKRLPKPEQSVVIGLDIPMFFSGQSLYSKVAPKGRVLAYTFKYLKPGLPNDPEQDKRELEGWLDLAQPGWRDVLIEKRFLPRMVVANALISAAQGGIPGRPGPAVPGIENLYVTGDWVGPRGMLADASLSSARQAAQLITALARQDRLVNAA